jgi:hypothetical protein
MGHLRAHKPARGTKQKLKLNLKLLPIIITLLVSVDVNKEIVTVYTFQNQGIRKINKSKKKKKTYNDKYLIFCIISYDVLGE